ncbi:MAG: SDR family oxidoreductase [Acidobacteriota bacterium]|nr:SDR family oxidoreductase [Acidobacteriota bacterium]
MEIRGAWALVTGGARRLGAGIARGLAAAGANVAVHHGHSREQAKRTVAEIQALGVEAFSAQADLADPDALASLFDTVATHCGRLDLLVNSAASFQRMPLGEITVDDWDAVVALNLRAPWLCLRHAVELMMAKSGEQRECGVVVNIADLTGVQAWAGYSHHGVSKAGLIHLTKIAARELAPKVRVNCVVPGAILPPPGMSIEDREWAAKRDRIPLQRTGEASDVAGAVVFLARSHFITGSVLAVDGGEHLIGGGPVA